MLPTFHSSRDFNESVKCQHIQKVSLSTSDHQWFISRLNQDEHQQRSEVLGIVQEFKESLLNTNEKLNKLLDSYLDNVVSREDYLKKRKVYGR